MRAFTAAEQAALEASTLIARDFMEITARDRQTGEAVTDAYWSDLGKITADMIHPDTGLPVGKVFQGAGQLIGIEELPAGAELQVQRLSVTMSQVSDRVNDLVRNYDIRQARVVIWRANLDRNSMQLVAPGRIRFVGFIDRAPVETPPEGQVGDIVFECVSSMQEMTRSNPDLRSHESQLQRAPGDDFYKSVTAAASQVIYWGSHRGPAAAAAPVSYAPNSFGLSG